MGSRIVFYGNCQMGRLAEGFAKIADYFPDFTDAVAYVNGEAANARDLLADARPDAVIYQVTRKQPEPPPGCNAIRLPALYIRPLWPFDAHDERIAPGVPGPITTGDLLVSKLRSLGLHPADAMRQYLAFDFSGQFDLDRMMDTHRARYRYLDSLSDVAMADWIEGNFRDQQLFNMFWHPTPVTYSQYAKPICDFLGLSGPHADIACKIVAATDTQLPEVPVHPKVATHFGLTWTAPDRTYQEYTDAITLHQWLWRHLTYEPEAKAA